jgi:hypothetical protein
MDPDPQKMLVGIIGDLKRYVEYLRDTGVCEVEIMSGQPPEIRATRNPIGIESGFLDARAGLDAIAAEISSALPASCISHDTRRAGQGNPHPEIYLLARGQAKMKPVRSALVGRAGQLLTRLTRGWV